MIHLFSAGRCIYNKHCLRSNLLPFNIFQMQMDRHFPLLDPASILPLALTRLEFYPSLSRSLRLTTVYYY